MLHAWPLLGKDAPRMGLDLAVAHYFWAGPHKDLFITFTIVSKIDVIVVKLKDWLDDAMYWQSKGVQQIFLENYLFYGGFEKLNFLKILS